MKVRLLRALWLGLLALLPCSAAVAQTLPGSLGTTNVQPGISRN